MSDLDFGNFLTQTRNSIVDSLDKLLTAYSLSRQGAKPVTVYNQRDPKWAGVRLGTSPRTIGSDGCLLCAYASALTDAGLTMTPPELNDWLNANNGYVNQNLFVFAAPDRLGVLKFENIADYQKPAPIQAIEDYLTRGGYVIVEVDFNPDPDIDPHYVRYLGNGQIADPWYGDIAPIVPRYRGQNAAEAIWRAAYYKPVA